MLDLAENILHVWGHRAGVTANFGSPLPEMNEREYSNRAWLLNQPRSLRSLEANPETPGEVFKSMNFCVSTILV